MQNQCNLKLLFYIIQIITYPYIQMKELPFWTIPSHRTTLFGQLISFFAFLSLFLVFPNFLKSIWPYFELMFTTQYQRHIGVIMITNILIFGSYNLVMYFIYTAKIPFLQHYRCSDKPWPWESEPEKWRKTLRKTLIFVLINMFICNPLLPLFQIALGGIKYKHTLEDFPDPFTIFWQLIFSMIMEDISFYWIHKTLHKPSFYWIHKIHHEHYNSVCIAATSAHPIEYIFGNGIPAGLGLSLLADYTPVHFATMVIWFTYRLIETCQGHCGYEWSWSCTSFLPFKLDSDYHNFHHAYNIGNYGSMFGFWDNMMDTNKQYRNFIRKGVKNQ